MSSKKCLRTQKVPGRGVPTSICGEFCARKIAFGFSNVLWPTEIAPVEFIGAEGENRFTLSGEAQIGGNDGKGTVFGQFGEDARRKNVNPREG